MKALDRIAPHMIDTWCNVASRNAITKQAARDHLTSGNPDEAAYEQQAADFIDGCLNKSMFTLGLSFEDIHELYQDWINSGCMTRRDIPSSIQTYMWKWG